MLTPEQVLNYIKVKLASPYIPLELTDEQILAIVRIETIPFFSRYIPHVNEVTIDTSDSKLQTGTDGVYYLIDPDDLPILNIVNFYIDMGGILLAGHPIIGLFSGSDEQAVVKYVLDVENSMTAYHWGLLRYEIEFIKPNKIRTIPAYYGKLLVRYEREHHPDFHTIPAEFKTHFLNLAYADVAKQIAKIRSQFRTLQTPFGTIELNPDVLLDEARDIQERFVEELKMYNPPVLVDRG